MASRIIGDFVFIFPLISVRQAVLLLGVLKIDFLKRLMVDSSSRLRNRECGTVARHTVECGKGGGRVRRAASV